MTARKKTKNSNNSGTVYYRKSDRKWIAAISVSDPLTGTRRRVTRVARNKAHGDMLRKELLLEHSSPPRVETALTDLVDAWLESPAVSNLADATQDSYRFAMTRHILPYLGHRDPADLTPVDVRSWHNAMQKQQVGLRTQENAHAVLSSCLSDAVRLGVLPQNVCMAVPRPKPISEEIRPFTRDEQARILALARHHRLFGVFYLGMRVGLRQGEMFGLTWQHVDLENGQLRVEQQAAESGGRVKIKAPKTRASRRTIQLHDRCAAALHRRKRQAIREGLDDCKWVFPSARGSVMRRSNFGHRHWDPLLRKVGVEHRGFHHTRHSAATAMLQHEPVLQVAGILGHASATVTLDIYGHYIPRSATSVATWGQPARG